MIVTLLDASLQGKILDKLQKNQRKRQELYFDQNFAEKNGQVKYSFVANKARKTANKLLWSNFLCNSKSGN